MTFQLLIVDDEATMRKGIAHYMNWSTIDCEVAGMASDGMEAIDFLKETPVDIVITDIKMPVADGLDVAKYVKEFLPLTKVILLSGYADFEYAKTAIKYNVTSFLLKPTNKKDLFEAVQSAQKQLIESRKHSSAASEGAAFLKEQLLQELTDISLTPSLSRRMKEHHLSLDHYAVAAFQLIPIGSELSTLKKIIINEKQNAYCYRYNDLILTIYYLTSSVKGIPDYIMDNCREITDILHALNSTQVAVGISRCHNTPNEFQNAVSEAISALSLNFYTESPISFFTDLTDCKEYDLTAENSLDLFQLENSLNSLQFEAADATVHAMFNKFRQNFTHALDAKNVCSQIYYIGSRVSLKKGITPPASEFLSNIHEASDIFALEEGVSALLTLVKQGLSDSIFRQNKLVEDTIKYIHTHLSDNLSLETIAEHLHISSSHLSRTFKKTCEEALTDYINRTRIERAKEYLINSDVLTYEISERVGYNDPAYFSSIFKKYTGLSPTDYKRQNSIVNSKNIPADLNHFPV